MINYTRKLEHVVEILNRRSKGRYGIIHSKEYYFLVQLWGGDARNGFSCIAWGKTKADLYFKIDMILAYLYFEKEVSEVGW
jgi:hypothetical protein